MIRFKYANDSISRSKEGPDSPQHEPLIEICKISASNTPNQPLIRCSVVGDSAYDTFEHFWKTVIKRCLSHFLTALSTLNANF